MDEFKCNNLIFSSSATVYKLEILMNEKVTEESTLSPINPYGNTKLTIEKILSDVSNSESGKWRIANLRYFNPVGAHNSSLIGELPRGIPDNLVPYITQSAIGKRKKLKVFGMDYETSDGTPVRDYIHVVDLANAHVQALNRLIEKKSKKFYEFFNVGTGRGYTVLEVIKSFEKVNNIKLPYDIVGRRQGDIEKFYSDTNLSRNELDWKAERNLDEMMKSAWKWQKRLKDLGS